MTLYAALAGVGVSVVLGGLFMVVVAGGPRIGDLYAGAAATLIALLANSLTTAWLATSMADDDSSRADTLGSTVVAHSSRSSIEGYMGGTTSVSRRGTRQDSGGVSPAVSAPSR